MGGSWGWSTSTVNCGDYLNNVMLGDQDDKSDAVARALALDRGAPRGCVTPENKVPLSYRL